MQIPNVNNTWSCMPAAFSMALNIPLEVMFEKLGHDGSEFVYKDKSQHRGFHRQECIDVAWSMGFACTHIDRYPAMTYSFAANDIFPVIFGKTEQCNLARLLRYIKECKLAVIEGLGINSAKQTTMGHACAWDGQHIFDPRHKTYYLDDCWLHNFDPTGVIVLTEV